MVVKEEFLVPEAIAIADPLMLNDLKISLYTRTRMQQFFVIIWILFLNFLFRKSESLKFSEKYPYRVRFAVASISISSPILALCRHLIFSAFSSLNFRTLVLKVI